MMPDVARIDPLTKLVARSPRVLAAALVVFAALCLIPVAVHVRDAFFPAVATAEGVSPLEAAAPPSLNRPDHVAYTLGGIVGAVIAALLAVWSFRSEERRVGKEGRSRGS